MNVVAAPHAHAGGSVRSVMLTVWAALLPATLFGIYQFGWPALNLLAVTTFATLTAEAACLRLAGKPVAPFVLDGSGLLTAWLLAMSLPPWAPWWLGALGGAFAAVVGKHVFGGLGQNLFNPAMLARVALLVSFPMEMTLWVEPHPLFTHLAPGFLDGLSITFHGITNVDAVSSASILGHAKTELGRGLGLEQALGDYAPLTAALGTVGGSLGETSVPLLLAGGLLLLFRRIITWHIPVAMLGSVALLAGAFHLAAPHHYVGPAFHLLNGGLLLGALFIATDPATSPSTPRGQLLFGTGCGALVYVIRTWGGYPEGVAFAVLLMNAATPLIDHYLRPRIYGRRRSGKPLPVAGAKGSGAE